MPYFTSWDVNVFLCLVSLGLPRDLVAEWLGSIKVEDRKFCLERDRSFHCQRRIPLSRFRKRRWGHWRRPTWSVRSGLNVVITEFKSKVEDIEPEDKYGYFEWAYENHYYTWSFKDLEWVKGFHPGRFFLMDHRRKETMEEIRDLEDIGAWQEERFIRTQDHIDDLLEGRKKNWAMTRVL